jgi:hypothetical protein
MLVLLSGFREHQLAGIGLGIDPEQQLALPDALVVNDGDFNHLAGNPGIYGILGVIGRDIRFLREVRGGADDSQHDRARLFGAGATAA